MYVISHLARRYTKSIGFIVMQKIKLFLVLIICVLFIASGAVNQGFSGFFMSLPFMITLIYTLKGCSFKVKVSSIVVVAILITPLVWKHEENKIIYPWIGDEFVADCGWKAVKYEQSYTGYNYETLIPKGAKVDEQYVISQRLISCDASWKLIRVFVHHPDLGTLYYPVFSITNVEATMSGYELNDAFEAKTLNHSQINYSYELQSEWTNNLSSLMMWPTIPILLLNGVMAIFV
ncbi:Conserved hypothetical protein; putative exported protein [Vibrio atlanticus]|uniref:Uncharacterized protein n=2 Tax=Vibrionaceae TaxID=641 RepID=B7VN58_VIBA3|nr:Conserved hypothetical protein; putative exported protein [Vibrio atlanticus]